MDIITIILILTVIDVVGYICKVITDESLIHLKLRYIPFIWFFSDSLASYVEKRSSKRKDLKYLKDYLHNLSKKETIFPVEYLSKRKGLISTIQWLIAYYENKTGCNPLEYLEALIDNTEVQCKEEIRLLYHWIKYRTIVGF